MSSAMMTLIVGGKTIPRVSKQTINHMCDSMPKTSSYTWLDEYTLFIDRKPMWIEYIIDSYRGYHVDFKELINNTHIDRECKQILLDDLQFFGISLTDRESSTRASMVERLEELVDNYALETEDSKLYSQIINIASNNTSMLSESDMHKIEQAEKLVAFAEYKEYIVSMIMSAARQGLRIWGDRTGVDTENLKKIMAKRLEDDDLIHSLHDFSENIKSIPILSWTVDNTRMFIINYFIKA